MLRIAFIRRVFGVGSPAFVVLTAMLLGVALGCGMLSQGQSLAYWFQPFFWPFSVHPGERYPWYIELYSWIWGALTTYGPTIVFGYVCYRFLRRPDAIRGWKDRLKYIGLIAFGETMLVFFAVPQF